MVKPMSSLLVLPYNLPNQPHLPGISLGQSLHIPRSLRLRRLAVPVRYTSILQILSIPGLLSLRLSLVRQALVAEDAAGFLHELAHCRVCSAVVVSWDTNIV